MNVANATNGRGGIPCSVLCGALLAALATHAARAAHAQTERALDRPPDQALPPTVDKSQYTLFNPTPRELWRPLSPDRPDFTESPYSVDAGAMQLEMSWAAYAKNSDTHAWAVAPANLKLGVLNNVDFQFEFAPYVHEQTGSVTQQGFGGVAFRAKINVWGNDGGPTALAIMPFIDPPTSSGGVGPSHVEGGVIVPFAVDVAEGIGVGAMFETAFVHDPAQDSYDTEFILTSVLSLDITDALGAYVEGIGIISTDSAVESRALLGTGLSYMLNDNLMLDLGFNIGLTGDADDVGGFSGITVRF